MDESTKVKNDLMTELNVQYRNLVNFLVTLPINQKFKDHCFQNLDQGIMWAQKGIELLVLTKKEDSAPEVKAPGEEKPEVVENVTVD